MPRKRKVTLMESMFGPDVHKEQERKEKYTRGFLEDSLTEYSPNIYRDPKFADLRTYTDSNDRIWLDGQEVCYELGYGDANYRRALTNYVDPGDRRQITLNNMANYTGRKEDGNYRHKTIINTNGFYDLVVRSHTPEARQLKQEIYKTADDVMRDGFSCTPQLKQVIEIDETYLNRIATDQEMRNRIRYGRTINPAIRD